MDQALKAALNSFLAQRGVTADQVKLGIEAGQIRTRDVRRGRLMMTVGAMGKKLIATSLYTGLIIAGLAQAAATSAPKYPVDSRKPSSSVSGTTPAQSMAAEVVARKMLTYVSSLTSRSDISVAGIEQAAGVILAMRDGIAGYRSPNLGNGWVYFLNVIQETRAVKRGLVLEFYNRDRAADIGVACAVPFETYRASLKASGYEEDEQLGELGEHLSWLYFKNDIVIAVETQAAVIGGEEVTCARSLRTNN